MKTTVYILFFLLVSWVTPAQEVLSTFHGMVSVKANKIEQKGNRLFFDLNIDLCGLSVGRYQTLSIIPMLRDGQNTVALKPVVVNGANKQKMYERTLAFKGKAPIDDIAYVVVKNNPALIRQISYRVSIPYKSWMKGAEFVLIGQFNDYDGNPQQKYQDILSDKLTFTATPL